MNATDKTALQELIEQGYEQINFKNENPHMKVFAKVNDKVISYVFYNTETKKVIKRDNYGFNMLMLMEALVDFYKKKKEK